MVGSAGPSLSRFRHQDVVRVEPVIGRVGADGGGRDDGVADVTVHVGGTDTGDRDRLGHGPVGRREGQAGFVDRTAKPTTSRSSWTTSIGPK